MVIPGSHGTLRDASLSVSWLCSVFGAHPGPLLLGVLISFRGPFVTGGTDGLFLGGRGGLIEAARPPVRPPAGFPRHRCHKHV